MHRRRRRRRRCCRPRMRNEHWDDSPIKSYHFGHCGLGEEITSTGIPVFISRTRNSRSVSSDSPSLVCQAAGGEGGLGWTGARHIAIVTGILSLSLSVCLIVVVSRLREWIPFFFFRNFFLGAIRMQFNRTCFSLPANRIERNESPRFS